MHDVGEGEEADTGDEGSYAHRLGPQYGRQQLADEDVEDGEGRSDAEFTNHRQAHGHPDRVCCDKGQLCIQDVDPSPGFFRLFCPFLNSFYVFFE